MTELFYFSFAEVMARIEYHRATNSLRYATHRKMACHERVIIEQYLLAEFALKTEYYKRQPASFIYLGADQQLIKVLNSFHLKSISHELEAKEVNDSVSGLISRSLQSYYFEQIGDVILEARRELAGGEPSPTEQERGWHRFSSEKANDKQSSRKLKLEELVKAYNAHADQKITANQIIPAELKSYFGMPLSANISKLAMPWAKLELSTSMMRSEQQE